MNKLYIVRLVQLILVVLLALIIFLGEMDDESGLHLLNNIKLVPLTLWCGVLVCGVLDIIYSKKWLHAIILGIFTITAILMYMDGSFAELNATLWLYGILYSPIALFRFARTKNKREEDVPYEVKGLPMGFFSTKQMIIVFSYLFGIVALYIAWIFAFELNPFLGLGVIFLITITATILIARSNPINKAIKKMNEDAVFSNFKNSLDLVLAENLHPETRAYVKTVYSNYLVSVNKEESIKLFESIRRPNNKEYAKMYDSIELLYYINKNDYETAKKLLQKYRIKYPKNNAFSNSVEVAISIRENDNHIDNIEQIFPLNTNMKFSNIGSANTLSYYYKTRNDLDKAKHYARLVLSYNSDLEEYNKAANEVLNQEIENNY